VPKQGHDEIARIWKQVQRTITDDVTRFLDLDIQSSSAAVDKTRAPPDITM